MNGKKRRNEKRQSERVQRKRDENVRCRIMRSSSRVVKVANTLDGIHHSQYLYPYPCVYTLPSPWPWHVHLFYNPYFRPVAIAYTCSLLEEFTLHINTLFYTLPMAYRCIQSKCGIQDRNDFWEQRFFLHCLFVFFTFISIVYLEYKWNQELNKVQLWK